MRVKNVEPVQVSDAVVLATSQLVAAPRFPAGIAFVVPKNCHRMRLFVPKLFYSLREQLKFTIKPELGQGHERYISQHAPIAGYKALAPSNWQQVPDLTVANLYWYLKDQTGNH